jgi:hypothetical protein
VSLWLICEPPAMRIAAARTTIDALMGFMVRGASRVVETLLVTTACHHTRLLNAPTPQLPVQFNPSERRARDSNPQPVSRHHISSLRRDCSADVQGNVSRTRLASWARGWIPPMPAVSASVWALNYGLATRRRLWGQFAGPILANATGVGVLQTSDPKRKQVHR